MCPPHSPIVPASEFVGKSGIDGKEGKYADWVYQGDHMLGQIMDALERTGQEKNTLLIATGDNGAAKRPYPPLREAKSSIYEGGHREPFVARWPGQIKAGSLNHNVICLNDLFATCADILGADLPADAAEDSVSILPALLGKASGPLREATINQAPAGLAIRQGPWKYIMYRNGNRELYNLKDDISETRDVSRANTEVVGRLEKLMQSYIDRGRSTPGPVQKNDFELPFGKSGTKKRNKKNKKAKGSSAKQEVNQ
jgi:arylsulfatase A-like enzyme